MNIRFAVSFESQFIKYFNKNRTCFDVITFFLGEIPQCMKEKCMQSFYACNPFESVASLEK